MNDDTDPVSSPKFYRVSRPDDHDFLQYTKMPESNAFDPTEWAKALKIRQRCDDAVFRTNMLLVQIKGKRREEYKARRRRYIEEIEEFARAGLELGDLDGAISDLDTFETQFVDFEGPSVRRRFLKKTLWYALCAGSLFLLLGLVTNNLSEIAKLFPAENPSGLAIRIVDILPHQAISAVLFIFVGACIGVVLSAFTRNLDMNFENLGNFDAAGLHPSLRFIFVGVLSVVAAIFLQQDLISICFRGDYCFDKTFVEPDVMPMKCIVIGIICGLGDAVITRILTETVNKAKSKEA